MGKCLDFLRNVLIDYIDKEAKIYAIDKAADILLELKLDDKKIIHVLSEHFDLKYSDASRVLDETKTYQKNKKQGEN